ncbi:MAG: DUF6318 family protein [Galactobacter sp.]
MVGFGLGFGAGTGAGARSCAGAGLRRVVTEGHTVRRAGGAVWLAPALGLVLVLSGCTGGPDPGKTFTPTASEKYVPPTRSSSGDASPSAGSGAGEGEYQPATETSPAKNVPVPEYPEAAKANTEDGQKAFIEYWFKTYNYTTVTGDSSAMESVSGSECEFCTFTYEGARTMVADHGVWIVSEGARPDLKNLKKGPIQDAEHPWDVLVLDSAAHFYDGDGKSDRYPMRAENSGVVRVWLQWVRGRWILLDYARVQED